MLSRTPQPRSTPHRHSTLLLQLLHSMQLQQSVLLLRNMQSLHNTRLRRQCNMLRLHPYNVLLLRNVRLLYNAPLRRQCNVLRPHRYNVLLRHQCNMLLLRNVRLLYNALLRHQCNMLHPHPYNVLRLHRYNALLRRRHNTRHRPRTRLPHPRRNQSQGACNFEGPFLTHKGPRSPVGLCAFRCCQAYLLRSCGSWRDGWIQVCAAQVTAAAHHATSSGGMGS